MQAVLQAILDARGGRRRRFEKLEVEPEPQKKCKWGRWAGVVPDVITLPGSAEARGKRSMGDGDDDVGHDDGDDDQSCCDIVDHIMDPVLWGELHRYVDVEEMVIAKLPLHLFYRARSVCKKWNELPWNRTFLETWSRVSWLVKPYFILHGDRGCHQAVLVKDMEVEKWVLKTLPSFGFQQPHTSVSHGLVYTGTFEGQIRGTVLNLHTKVFRRLPALDSEWMSSNRALSILAVDEKRGGGEFKVLVAWSLGITYVYDSLTDVWTRGSKAPNPVMDEEDNTFCDGVIYIKWKVFELIERSFRVRQYLFAYRFGNDSWSVLAIAPHGSARVRGLGEWNGVVRDLTLDDDGVLHVWELQEELWVEVDRMPEDMLAWFLEPYGLADFLDPLLPAKIKTSYCDQYMLMFHHGFSEQSGLARIVQYDMELKSWETLPVTKDWTCPCPFSRKQVRQSAHQP